MHAQSCLTLCDPWTVACQAPLSMEFSRQEYWSRLPFPTPGDWPDPGIKPMSLVSPALAGRFFFFFTTVPPEKPNLLLYLANKQQNTYFDLYDTFSLTFI